MTSTDALRVVVFCEGDKWVAQCVEFDIGAQADDLDTLRTVFAVALEAEISESIERHGAALQGIPAAPKRFEEMWAKQSTTFRGGTMSMANVGVELGLVA